MTPSRMDIQQEFEDWIIKENIHPRIDLRKVEGSYLCDDDYEGNGNLMVSADIIIEFIKKKYGIKGFSTREKKR